MNEISSDNQSFKVGIHLSPNGYGPTFRYTWPYRKQWSMMTDLSFTSVKNIKEKSVINQRMINTTSYIYGKVNRLYAFRPMFGFHRVFAEKENKNSIGINYFACGGPVLGFLKPNYVDRIAADPNSPTAYITLSSRYNPELVPDASIIGYSSFGRGMSETKLLGGLSFKAGADFNWGYYSSGYKSIELGFMIDCYPSRPELMYGIKNKVFYSSFYISFAIGETD